MLGRISLRLLNLAVSDPPLKQAYAPTFVKTSLAFASNSISRPSESVSVSDILYPPAGIKSLVPLWHAAIALSKAVVSSVPVPSPGSLPTAPKSLTEIVSRSFACAVLAVAPVPV